MKPSSTPITSGAAARPVRLLIAWALTLVVACGPDRGTGPAAITRDAFVAAYVDLRVAGLRDGVDRIDERTRDSILAAHGVTQEQLLAFAQRRGGDLALMREVWNEIEARLDSVPLPEGP